MDVISYSKARANLAETMDRVCEDHTPILITHKNKAAVVMMSLEDYRIMEETAYLLRSPVNACRLFESMAEVKFGNDEEHLIE